MPAQFFTATDDKPTGTANAYKRFTTFIRQNNIQLSVAITDRDDIHAAIGDIWDAIGGDIPTFRAEVSGALNSDASDLEIATLTYMVLREKFIQYGATLPGGGGP